MTNIYFLINRVAGTVKIGKSNNLQERLITLQVANSAQLEFLYIIENVEDAFELHTHGICEKYHISGEWFRQEVIENHLLKHPFYKNAMKPWKIYLKDYLDKLEKKQQDE